MDIFTAVRTSNISTPRLRVLLEKLISHPVGQEIPHHYRTTGVHHSVNKSYDWTLPDPERRRLWRRKKIVSRRRKRVTWRKRQRE
jgi:hypothetical protein